MMAAPAVIATPAGARLARAREFGFGERRHLLIDAQFLCCGIECGNSRAELPQQSVLRRKLIAVRVETVERAEKDLPAHSQRAAHLNDLRYLLELLSEWCARETASTMAGAPDSAVLRVLASLMPRVVMAFDA